MQIVININDELYKRFKTDKYIGNYEQAWNDIVLLLKTIEEGTPLPKGHDVETILQKTTGEVFVQCKQFNGRYSKDWNEGFNDGMFHTMTIIKKIIKADKEET